MMEIVGGSMLLTQLLNIIAMVVKIKLESIKGCTGMNNFDPRLFEPFWGSWYIDSLIDEGSIGYVYKIYKEEFGQKYFSILKIISLPKSEEEAKEILYESKDQDSTTQYFCEIADVIYKEIKIMEGLKDETNIVSFDDHVIIRKEDGIGYYIVIRMEVLTCLNRFSFEDKESIESKAEKSNLDDTIIKDEDEETVLLFSANKAVNKEKNSVVKAIVAFLIITVIVVSIEVFIQLNPNNESGIETINVKATSNDVEEAVPEVID